MGWRNIVTIEPAMFLQMAGDTLTYVIYQNLFIDKICQTQLNYDKAICDSYAKMTNQIGPTQEAMLPIMTNIQEASASFVLYNSLVENSFPVILVLFLGVWSDANRRRKPPLLLSLVGKLLRSCALLVNAWFMNWHPIILLLTAALPHSLGGANAVFHMASFSYIADSSVPRSRTLRLGIAEACWQLGSPVGFALGAYLFKTGGYLCVFGTSVAFHLIAVIYTWCILPEVPQPKPPQYKVGNHGWYGTWTNGFEQGIKPKRIRYYSEHDPSPAATAPATSVSETGGSDSESNNNAQQNETQFLLPPLAEPHGKNQNQYRKYNDQYESSSSEEDEKESSITVKDFIIGSMKSIVKKRPNHTRKCLLSLGLIMLLYGITYNGELSMKYLFTRNKFNWREQEFSSWVIFEALMVCTGLFVAMPILSKLLKFSDPFSGMLAAIGRLTSRAFFAFAPSSKYLYIGSMIEISGVIGPLSARSLASKCVLRDERGRVFAFLGCIEALVPLIAVPLYSSVYSLTLAYAPSTIYYVSCGIYFVIVLIFGVLFASLKLKLVQFTGTDTSSLTNPTVEALQVIPGTSIPYCYRRTSLY